MMLMFIIHQSFLKCEFKEEQKVYQYQQVEDGVENIN